MSVSPSSEWLTQHYSFFRNLPLSSIKLVGDHFLYTCDINVWFRGDIIRRYKMPVIILNYNNLKLYSLLQNYPWEQKCYKNFSAPWQFFLGISYKSINIYLTAIIDMILSITTIWNIQLSKWYILNDNNLKLYTLL